MRTPPLSFFLSRSWNKGVLAALGNRNRRRLSRFTQDVD